MIQKLTQDLAIISKLGDNPGSENNLTTAALRAKFDAAALIIQQYINDVLVPALGMSSNPAGGLVMQGTIDMAGYSLTGLKEPSNDRDAVSLEFAKKTFALATELTDLLNDIDAAAKAAEDAKTAANAAGTLAAEAKLIADAALPASGGAITGVVTLTRDIHYGDELPAAGTEGRIFFKKV
jgi:hypothetical protein